MFLRADDEPLWCSFKKACTSCNSREPSGWELARGLRGTIFRDRFKRLEEDCCLIAAEDPIQNIQARLPVEKRACDFPVR